MANLADLKEISHNFYQFSYNSYLAEIKNFDKPEEHHFPSETAFFEDFSDKVNVAYHNISRNYPPEVAKYIYESMLFNLNRYSQNPAQCHIIDPSTGSINSTTLQATSKKVAEALQAKYPDKFVEVSAVKEESSVKDGVDFRKTEEVNKYFDSLFQEYNKLQTSEEKEKFKRNNFGHYDEYKEEIDSVFAYEEEMSKLKEEKPELNDEERSTQACDNIGTTKEVIAINREITIILKDLDELENQLKKINENSPEVQDLKKQRLDLKNKINQLQQEKNKQKIETNDTVNKNIDEKENDNALADILNENISDEKDDNELQDLLDADIDEQKDDNDLEDLLNASIENEDTIDISDIFNNIEEQEIVVEESTSHDSILEQTEKQPLVLDKLSPDEKQAEETSLIKYKPNRLKVFFNNLISKIKKSNLFRRLTNKNETNIDIINYENSSQKEENRKSFDDTLIVSKEEQEKYRIEYERNKQNRESISVSLGIQEEHEN